MINPPVVAGGGALGTAHLFFGVQYYLRRHLSNDENKNNRLEIFSFMSSIKKCLKIVQRATLYRH